MPLPVGSSWSRLPFSGCISVGLMSGTDCSVPPLNVRVAAVATCFRFVSLLPEQEIVKKIVFSWFSNL